MRIVMAKSQSRVRIKRNLRTGYHVLLILFFLFQKFLDDVNLDLFLTEYVKLHRDLFCLLVIYFLIDGDNLAL